MASESYGFRSRSPCTLLMAQRVVWIWISAPKATRAGSSSRRLPGRPPVELSVPLSRTSLSLIRAAIMRETWASDSPLRRARSAPDRCLLSSRSRTTVARPAPSSRGGFSFCCPALLSIDQVVPLIWRATALSDPVHSAFILKAFVEDVNPDGLVPKRPRLIACFR